MYFTQTQFFCLKRVRAFCPRYRFLSPAILFFLLFKARLKRRICLFFFSCVYTPLFSRSRPNQKHKYYCATVREQHNQPLKCNSISDPVDFRRIPVCVRVFIYDFFFLLKQILDERNAGSGLQLRIQFTFTPPPFLGHVTHQGLDS